MFNVEKIKFISNYQLNWENIKSAFYIWILFGVVSVFSFFFHSDYLFVLWFWYPVYMILLDYFFPFYFWLFRISFYYIGQERWLGIVHHNEVLYFESEGKKQKVMYECKRYLRALKNNGNFEV
jgi:hypothetical protein